MPDAFPLAWPSDYIRTRIEARQERKAWKKTPLQYRDEILKELDKDDAKSIVISTNVDPTHFSNPSMVATMERRDPGVAVYFALPPTENSSWQDVLGIAKPDPSVDEINKAYRELSKKYHTDNVQTGGDIEMFKLITEARKNALAWVTGDYDKEHQHIVACDAWTKVAWNMKGICVMLSSLRKAKASGATGMLDRMYAQMKALPGQAGEGEE